MRGLAEGGAEEAVEVEVGEACLAGGLLEEDAGLVFGCEEIACAAEAAEGVVVDELAERGHEGMVIRWEGIGQPCKGGW